ncbi:NAD(P)/FAD-dependent oxidoreductase [Spirulina subsalsa FACHB-351]|uniref:NAD(P)/FAD-dependent oxidoreductase n=1 Tax=Spirulina subsalsa FACHB-351 TaxID=234711 RepID=A0ABT3L365_9CYAN|nr:NAD(P)/FAD-dependent oxidoreductase [Spirulina subsalsa]MCW6035946.1 NAD(P)/FAD-dependent oxidoreductase [Spirulina subsalsa FACHB-351]
MKPNPPPTQQNPDSVPPSPSEDKVPPFPSEDKVPPFQRGARGDKPLSWGIVGGGILGMTLAQRLIQAGQRVTLIESAPQLGGLASAWQLDDLIWDRHYHVTLLSDSHLRGLLRELGLEDQMRWVETKTGVYANGQLYSVSNALEFLLFPPLNLIDKIRLAVTILYASRIQNWRKLEQISVVDWLRRWSGDRTLKKFWLPLLRSKLGDNYPKASAAFIWAIIARLYAARRTGLKKEMFGYLPGGYARLLEQFSKALTAQGVKINLGQPVQRVQAAPSGTEITFRDGSSQIFDQVIITAAAPLAAQLCPQLTETEIHRLHSIQYQGIICASLLLRRPLATYYVTNITDDGIPFTGVIEMTTLVKPEEFGGRTLVYLPKYVPVEDTAFQLTDEELKAQFMTALLKMYPHLHPDDLLSFQVSRVKYVLPISTLNYSRNLPPMTTSIPGIHIVNSAHILNGTLNINETIQLAERAIKEILSPQPTQL